MTSLRRRLDAIEARLAAKEAATVRVIVMREDTEGHAEPESVAIYRPDQPPQRINRKPSELAATFLRRSGCHLTRT